MLKSDFRLIGLRVLDDVLERGKRLQESIEERITVAEDGFKEISKVYELCFGILREKTNIDYFISFYIQKPPKDITLQNILRIGFYQLNYMDSIPDYAAIHSAVETAKAAGLTGKSGFVNGVLRNIARDAGKIREIRIDDRLENLAVRYSFPKWMVALIEKAKGDNKMDKILSAGNERAHLFLRANTLKTKADSLAKQLLVENVETINAGVVNALIVTAGDVFKTTAYEQGLFYAQDISSQMFATLVAAKAGDNIIDVGSAPGGKASYYAADMKGQGTITAVEFDETRLASMLQNFRRLGVENVVISRVDAAVEKGEYENTADKVTVDAPCSALGTVRRHPEKKWLIKQEDLKKYPELQLKILNNVKKWVKQGGELYYSTCTINPGENQEVVEKFLAENEEFELVNITKNAGLKEEYSHGNYFLSLPGNSLKADGFFAAKLIKK